MMVRRLDAAGLDGSRSAVHLFRHTFGHLMKASGASDEDIMTLGGWKDPRSMQRYGASAAAARARATHRNLSPGDRI
jgi:integrase